jgi:hypothetical protein
VPVRNRRTPRRGAELSPLARRWLLGERCFWGLLAGCVAAGWLPDEQRFVDRREFWLRHRHWALAEARRLDLPEPWQEQRFAKQPARP